MSAPFDAGDALSALVGLQGLLLAAAGLLMVVMQSDQSRRISLPVFAPMTVLRLVSLGGCVVGVGAIAAWISVFTGGSFVDWNRVIIAAAALTAILVMTFVTGLLLLARRT